MEHISGDSFIQKEARPLFDVNTLQHLPDGFAVMTGLGVARLAFSSPLRVERQEISLKNLQCWRKRTRWRSTCLRPTAKRTKKRMMILRGLYCNTGAVQRQPREAAEKARNAENTADPALAGKKLCSRRSWLRDGWGLRRYSQFTASGQSGGRKGCWSGQKYPVDSRQVSVWGLTPHGVAFSFDEDER
ncbi:hypothetical protein [Klebsiella pneumoniae]|uniref:hypothetical protein n=1 Tax=Klebsiella pneumoniae TaxID=573 RepID=UPI0022B68B52|nr:hypothetical protein [Klebsiella pneumoniae]